nr:MAG TPA: Transcriptional regulator [Caudoviricetes sp.]
MDIMLERMLSLIPKKENGKYVHGAKKEFCEAIGAPTNIVSEWEAGKTKSYRNYLYVVSAKYNVSIEWLKGETDEKGIKKGPIPEDEADNMMNPDYLKLNAANRAAIDAAIAAFLASQQSED